VDKEVGMRSGLRTLWIAVSVLTATPAFSQPYPGPPSDGGTYWVVPAFADQPEAGPQKAKGVILWSHGRSGQNPQWQSPPPDVIRDLGRAGWDVVKINRHGLHERSWTDTGRKHVAHLIALAQTKRDAGYRRVVAAGQSYGGAISIEAAAAAPDLFHGVFAAAPGHGSDACFGGPSVNSAQQMMPLLVGAIDRHRAGRTVILMAPGDNCQGPNRPTGTIRAALQATGRPSSSSTTAFRSAGTARSTRSSSGYGTGPAYSVSSRRRPSRRARTTVPRRPRRQTSSSPAT
jgi:pimeloyl-ACP methyl ester carboxylesterase